MEVVRRWPLAFRRAAPFRRDFQHSLETDRRCLETVCWLWRSTRSHLLYRTPSTCQSHALRHASRWYTAISRNRRRCLEESRRCQRNLGCILWLEDHVVMTVRLTKEWVNSTHLTTTKRSKRKGVGNKNPFLLKNNQTCEKIWMTYIPWGIFIAWDHRPSSVQSSNKVRKPGTESLSPWSSQIICEGGKAVTGF